MSIFASIAAIVDLLLTSCRKSSRCRQYEIMIFNDFFTSVVHKRSSGPWGGIGGR